MKSIKAFTTWKFFASFIKIVLILSWQSWFRTFIYFRLLQVLLTAKNVIYYVLTKMIRNSVGHLILCYQKYWILLLPFNSHHKIICSSVGETIQYEDIYYVCIISIINKNHTLYWKLIRTPHQIELLNFLDAGILGCSVMPIYELYKVLRSEIKGVKTFML